MERLSQLFIGCLIFFSCLSMGWAEEIKRDQSPWLILNAEDISILPTHFRSTRNLKLKLFPRTISTIGLQDVPMSGSAQFSKKQLMTMLPYLPSSLVIVDLRQESHGFINDGLALSWYGYHNQANINDSLLEVKRTEKSLLNGLLTNKTAAIYKLKKTRPLGPYENTKEVTFWKILDVSAVFTESQLTKETNIGYLRLPITDRHKPLDETVDTFLIFLKEMSPNTWLHFHCAAGVGRTTMLMVMYDIIKNAKRVSLKEIIARQGIIGPLTLTKLPTLKSWNYPLAHERLVFIEKFYQYIFEVGDSFDPLWSDWIKKHSSLSSIHN